MVDKVTLVMADISMAAIFYPLTKLVDAVWKPSQEALDHRLRFYTSLSGDGSKSSLLFVKDALKKGGNPDIEMQEGLPLVVAAARLKLGKVVEALGESGANLNAKDKYGDTALVNSTVEGDIATVEYLLGKKVDINAKTIQEHGSRAVATFDKASIYFNLEAALEVENAAKATTPAPKAQAVTASL